MKTPWKTVDAALRRAGIDVEDISDERRQGHPVFVYFGTRGICRNDGAHMVSGETAGELIHQIKWRLRACNCDECTGTRS